MGDIAALSSNFERKTDCQQSTGSKFLVNFVKGDWSVAIGLVPSIVCQRHVGSENVFNISLLIFACLKSACFQVLKRSGFNFISSFIQSPNAAVACPFIQRSLVTAKSACKKPDTDSAFVRVPTRDPSLGSTLSPHPKNPLGSGTKSNPSLLLVWFILFLRYVVFQY